MVLTEGRRQLVKELWPDKLLFGSVLLFMAGIAGALFGLVNFFFEVDYSTRIPSWLRFYPAWLTIVASLAALGLAYWCLRERDTRWALYGSAAGLISFGMLGLGSVLSLLALGFIIWARYEREDTAPETLRLTPEMWPDKSLAAGQIMFVDGLVTLGWGLGLAFGWIETAFATQQLYGFAGILVGLVCLYSAVMLYFQRARWVSLGACVAAFLCLGFWVVGPLLSVVAFVLVVMASREDEFESQQALGPSA